MLILEVLAQQSFALWGTEKGRGGERGDPVSATRYVLLQACEESAKLGCSHNTPGGYPSTSALYIFFFRKSQEKIIPGFPSALYLLQASLFSHSGSF